MGETTYAEWFKKVGASAAMQEPQERPRSTLGGSMIGTPAGLPPGMPMPGRPASVMGSYGHYDPYNYYTMGQRPMMPPMQRVRN